MSMRLAAATLFLAVLPCLGFAQAPARAPLADNPTASSIATNAPGLGITPLWGTSDGRILAMVAFGAASHGAPALPQSPQIGSATDWQLIDVTNFVTGGLSLQLGSNFSTYADFGQGIVLQPLNPAAASFGCNASPDSWMSPTFSCLQPQRSLAKTGTLRIGTDLSAGDFNFDLNYGLSWLHYADQPYQDGSSPDTALTLFSGIGNESLPTLVVPGMQPSDMRNFGINASTHWRLSKEQSFDLGAALGRIRFDLPGTSATPVLNQAALSFGIHRGDFSGIIVGRMLGSSDPLSSGQHWSSVDLGISWRAPWRGIFSVGAQNLWSSGYPPLAPAASLQATDPGMARVPYVQYHQDL